MSETRTAYLEHCVQKVKACAEATDASGEPEPIWGCGEHPREAIDALLDLGSDCDDATADLVQMLSNRVEALENAQRRAMELLLEGSSWYCPGKAFGILKTIEGWVEVKSNA